MTLSLKDRIGQHANKFQYELPNKLPVIIIINGIGFNRITSLLDKPFSLQLAQCFGSALLSLMREVEGAIFGYSYSDKLVLVSRNDQSLETQPWLNNSVQKLASITASIATLAFNTYAASIDLTLSGEAIFSANTFVVPNITEAINTLISAQQEAYKAAANSACFYELLKDRDKNTIKDMLSGLSIEDKISLLQQECNISFNKYQASFRRGVACYKVPTSVFFEEKEMIKYKLMLDNDLPVFTADQGFLSSILRS